MNRSVFSLASLLSLVLLIATFLTTAIGCARGLVLAKMGDAYNGHFLRIFATRGLFQFQRLSLADKNRDGEALAYDFTDGWHGLGWNYHAENLEVGGPYPTKIVGEQLITECTALWPIALTAILPTTKLASIYYRHRTASHSGLYRRCGYDCRATPDKCPECGTAQRG